MAANGRLVEPSGSFGAPTPAARLRGARCSGFGIVEVGVVSIGMSDEVGGTGCCEEGGRRAAICRTWSRAASSCRGVGPAAMGGGGPLNAPPGIGGCPPSRDASAEGGAVISGPGTGPNGKPPRNAPPASCDWSPNLDASGEGGPPSPGGRDGDGVTSLPMIGEGGAAPVSGDGGPAAANCSGGRVRGMFPPNCVAAGRPPGGPSGRAMLMGGGGPAAAGRPPCGPSGRAASMLSKGRGRGRGADMKLPGNCPCTCAVGFAPAIASPCPGVPEPCIMRASASRERKPGAWLGSPRSAIERRLFGSPLVPPNGIALSSAVSPPGGAGAAGVLPAYFASGPSWSPVIRPV